MAEEQGADWARPVVHWEIEAEDPERQRAFYAAVFNWDISDGPIMSIGAGLGGPEPGPAGHIRQSNHRRVSLYVQVRDLASAIESVVANGGAVVAERFQIPDGATLAMVTDPEDNPLTLVQQ